YAIKLSTSFDLKRSKTKILLFRFPLPNLVEHKFHGNDNFNGNPYAAHRGVLFD
ncbi:MAG: hypothetical protein ACJA1B_001631, partial [Polaribacter sp.]